jgi:hypothetical protein
MAFLAPAAAGAAGSGLATSAIGSAGGLSSGDLAAGLAASPSLAGITPSMVTGASAAIPPSSGILSGLKGLMPNSLSSLLDPLTQAKDLMGGSQSQPPQFPQLQHSQGQPVNPITSSPVPGLGGPLGAGAGLNPQLMKLIQMLSGGGGGLS